MQTMENFENQTHSQGFFQEKMIPMFKDFLQKTDPKLQHIPGLKRVRIESNYHGIAQTEGHLTLFNHLLINIIKDY